MYAAAAKLNEKKHVQPSQPDRFDREEVDGEQAIGDASE
jgi:hypothetical protein